MSEHERWHELAQQLRVDSVRAAAGTNSGHPTSSMSAADLMAVLLAKYLRYDFDDPENPANDHLIFSKGHASPLLYSLFHAAGAITEAERGVLVCGSGVGASVAANKLAGIRAAICHDAYSAHQGVEHDDMNVLCLGSEVIGAELAAELLRAFLGATFDGGDRYVRRLEKVEEMEREKTYG